MCVPPPHARVLVALRSDALSPPAIPSPQGLRGQRGPQRFTLERAFGDPEALPSSHTCFNTVVLPQYTDADVLREKLLIAIREGAEGFGLI